MDMDTNSWPSEALMVRLRQDFPDRSVVQIATAILDAEESAARVGGDPLATERSARVRLSAPSLTV